MTGDEPFTKQERLTYGIMGVVTILGVVAFVTGVDIVPILTAIAGLFAGINLPSPFDKAEVTKY